MERVKLISPAELIARQLEGTRRRLAELGCHPRHIALHLQRLETAWTRPRVSHLITKRATVRHAKGQINRF
jgi:hypothetical protein